jgi:prepilin-type N-terminal cleavage/methylation domain-containing protein
MLYSIKKKMSARGFTLIELLVVIAIIGVLATVVLASLNTARRKSRDARRLSDIKQIQLALELYFDGVGGGNYPLGDAAVCSATVQYGTQVLAPNYITTVPRDPNAAAASNCYRYASIVPTLGTARTSYHLGAVLEDPTNTALTGDRDCNDGVVNSCGAAVAVGVGGTVQGIESADCIAAAGAAGTDRCYDVTP